MMGFGVYDPKRGYGGATPILFEGSKKYSMNEPVKKCCGAEPKSRYDVSLKKWVFECPKCGKSTNGHSAKKKALESWNKLCV